MSGILQKVWTSENSGGRPGEGKGDDARHLILLSGLTSVVLFSNQQVRFRV